jgi:autoinducer 2-degrading protein
MYTLFVTLDIRPDKIDQFLGAITANAIASRDTEPGCLTFDVHQENQIPARFYLYEIYEDESAFTTGHCEAPHYAQWQGP